MVQKAIHDWSKHVGEDVLSNKVHRVFNDYKSEVEELVHNEGDDWIVMVKIWITEVDVTSIHDGIKVAIGI